MLQHVDHLGALLVDGRGVEVVDLDVFLRPHGVRQRPLVLAELAGAKLHHLGDPLHRRAAHVGAELLVAEHRQPLLQTELEPVAAGDPVARPVVKILVGDDPLDQVIVAIGRGLGRGEDILGVEDVQPLVLHRAHVEVVHRDDVEHLEMILAAIDLLVPLHRANERIHRVFRPRLVTGADPDVQLHLPARHGGEAAGKATQVTRDEGEEVGGLGPGIIPDALAHRVAVGEPHGHVAVDMHLEGSHHVGPVGVEGDLAEALGLALGAIHAARGVEPVEGSIRRRVDPHFRLPGEGAGGHRAGEALRPDRRLHVFPVYPGPDQLELLAMQEDLARLFRRRVWREADLRAHPGVGAGKGEPELHLLHHEGEGRVIGEANGLGGGVFHVSPAGNEPNRHLDVRPMKRAQQPVNPEP